MPTFVNVAEELPLQDAVAYVVPLASKCGETIACWFQCGERRFGDGDYELFERNPDGIGDYFFTPAI